MNDIENKSSNQSTARASASSSAATTGVSLVESRRSNRTFGCVGLSVCVHVAFLAALAIAPDSIRNMGGGDGQEAGAGGSVSMIESSNAGGDNAATAADQPVEVSVMTDSSSDIVMSPVKTPEKLPEKLAEKLPEKKVVEPKVEAVVPPPVEKPVAKKTPKVEKAPAPEQAKPVVAAAVPVITEDQGVPVEDVKTEPIQEQEVEPEQVAPVAKLAPVVEKSAPVEESAQEIAEENNEPVVTTAPAAQQKAAPQLEEQTGQDDPAPVLLANPPGDGAGSDQGSDANEEGGPTTALAAGQGGDQSGEGGQNAGGSGAMIGPIRDASELRALPGNPNPVYPARDRLARKEGTAIILGRVSADGRVTDLKLEKSSGSQAMDSASLQAFRSWRFQGGQQGWVRKPFQFRLVGEAKEVPAPLGKTLKR